MPQVARGFLAVALVLACVASVRADEAQQERGRYLAAIMDCAGCHTPMAPEGGPDFSRALQGANYGFGVPGLGVFVPPNLTSDAETGLGGWSAEEIGHAVTTGERPDGRILAPIMPWASYAALTPDDLAALIAYLQSLPPVSYQAPGPFGPEETPSVPYLGLVMP